MRVLIIHNRYRSGLPSGENRAVDRQVELLTNAGHQVELFSCSSDEIRGYKLQRRLALPARVVWSLKARRDVSETLVQSRPDVVHVHNTFPLISPSILAPCADAAPVVVSLHNYRIACPQGQLLRNGASCELCVGHVPWRSIQYGCYRESRLATGPLALAVSVHRALNIWNRHASAFVALSAFSAGKLVAGGLDSSRLKVLPNFSPRPMNFRQGPGDHFLFLGRLSTEKAPEVLVEAWRAGLGRLLVVGDGPMHEAVERLASKCGDAVHVLGSKSATEAMALLARARALIIPSRAFEASPLVIAEAFARGVPVIAPRHGAFEEMVRDGETGRLFASGNASDLLAAIGDLRDDTTSVRMGTAAVKEYERHFSPEQYLARLLSIYAEASATANRKRRPSRKRTASAGRR
jgi:glycosyltransferase involved in cell wall biosynthesis